MIINLIKFYFILGIFIIGIGLITELITIKKFPKIQVILLLYLIWPFFFYWYIKYVCIYIDFILRFSKKNNKTYFQAFKDLISEFPKSGSLFN